MGLTPLRLAFPSLAPFRRAPLFVAYLRLRWRQVRALNRINCGHTLSVPTAGCC